MKKNKIKKNYRIATAAYAFVLVVALIVSSASGLPENSSLSAVMTGNIAAPQISAAQAMLTDENGKVLYEKNSRQKAYPASTTKILTCITALDIMEEIKADIDQRVTVPKEAEGVEGSSVYLKAGERITFKDLLYSAMLRSGNDAATAIAIIAGGSEAEFVRLMNEKASEIGCTGSNFINPTGLFDENHYTTAADMAKIAAYAMKNHTFRQIASAEEYTAKRQAFAVTQSAGKEYIEYRMYNKNKTVHEYEGATGIKIGYTKASGRTLAASAARGECEVIAVVMAAPDWFNDAYRLMDYGFGLLGEE